ncbi:MAG: GNAT family N-acetyltransferase [Gemmatimonadaceae bacterium]
MVVAADAGTGVVRVEDHHAALLAEFFRRVWDPGATVAGVLAARRAAAAENPIRRGEDVPTFVFLKDGRVVGHVGTLPIRVWNSGIERPAHWVKGLMVLPEQRNGPVGFLLLREAVRHLGDAMALVVQPAPRRLFQALGFADLGVLPNYLRVLRPAALMRRLDLAALGLTGLPRWLPRLVRSLQRTGMAGLAGALGGGAMGLWARAAGGAEPVVTPAALDGREVDDLWRRVRGSVSAAPVRDARHVGTLQARGGEGAYVSLSVRGRSALEGYAIVRRPHELDDGRLRGIRMATLSDVLFPPHMSGVGLALIAGAEEIARGMGADALVCSASHAALRPLLRRRAFAPIPGNVHVLFRPNALDTSAPPSALDGWWLLRGDSAADEVF